MVVELLGSVEVTQLVDPRRVEHYHSVLIMAGVDGWAVCFRRCRLCCISLVYGLSGARSFVLGFSPRVFSLTATGTCVASITRPRVCHLSPLGPRFATLINFTATLSIRGVLIARCNSPDRCRSFIRIHLHLLSPDTPFPQLHHDPPLPLDPPHKHPRLIDIIRDRHPRIHELLLDIHQLLVVKVRRYHEQGR